MKKILVAALLFSAPILATAQKPQKGGERRAQLTAEQRAEKNTARIDKIVQLTPEQHEKIHAENLRAAQSMMPHMEAIRKEREAMREEGKRRHDAYASILTPEQMAKLEEARKQRREHGMRGERGAQPGGAGMRAPAPTK